MLIYFIFVVPSLYLYPAVRILATKLVEQWLKIVKSESVVEAIPAPVVQENNFVVATTNDVQLANTNAENKDNSTTSFPTTPDSTSEHPPISHMSPSQSTIDSSMVFVDSLATEEVDSMVEEAAADLDPLDIGTQPEPSGRVETVESKPKGLVYKITLKDGKQMLAKVDSSTLQKNSSPVALKLVAAKRKITDDGVAAVQVKQRKNSEDLPAAAEAANNSESDSSKPSDGDSVDKSPVGDSLERLASSKDTDRSKEKSKSSRDREREREKERIKDRKDSKSTSSSSRPSSSSSSSKHRSSSSSNKNNTSSTSRSSRDDKDRHRSSSSKTSSSSTSRDKSRDKGSSSSKSESTAIQASKDKETLSMIMPQSINKLGKIPKKSRDSDAEKAAEPNVNVASSPTTTKKPSISIEVRKDFENRPKTVKTFNSKFRSHGLAEEAPPPPSRRGLKKPVSTPSAPGTTIPPSILTGTKRHSISPTPEMEKKPKLDVIAATNHVDKPGSIKLISPKPKRKYPLLWTSLITPLCHIFAGNVLLTTVLLCNWLMTTASHAECVFSHDDMRISSSCQSRTFVLSNNSSSSGDCLRRGILCLVIYFYMPIVSETNR